SPGWHAKREREEIRKGSPRLWTALENEEHIS
ncbi:unnamed protein product, partial [marine sediment metagenome]